MNNTKKGVTLLLAVLISSIALSVGVGIFSLLFSEIEISGSAKDSVNAFYAADSGLECTLYWESLVKKGLLLKSPFAINGLPTTITCNNSTYSVGPGTCVSGNPNCTGEFYPRYTDGIASCAHVTVEKENSSGIVQTRLNAAGENRNQCNIPPTSSRIVQQGGQYLY